MRLPGFGRKQRDMKTPVYGATGGRPLLAWPDDPLTDEAAVGAPLAAPSYALPEKAIENTNKKEE